MTFKPKIADATRELLKNRPRSMSVETIVENTSLTTSWIVDFARYPQRDHGVNKVEELHFFLTGENLINDDSK